VCKDFYPLLPHIIVSTYLGHHRGRSSASISYPTALPPPPSSQAEDSSAPSYVLQLDEVPMRRGRSLCASSAPWQIGQQQMEQHIRATGGQSHDRREGHRKEIGCDGENAADPPRYMIVGC